MPYFNFNYVTDPPDDENVNAITQLNNNWAEVETKTKPFNSSPANFTGITVPVGTEAFDPEHAGSEDRIAVWDGTTWRRGLNHVTAWSNWDNLTLRSPTVARTGFPPVARVDIIARRVTLMGGVYFNAAIDPWPTNTTVEITNDTAIQTSLAPVNGGMSVSQGATGQITTANGFAAAVIIVELKSSPSRVAVSVRYQGDAGGGNFIMLDGVEWWY